MKSPITTRRDVLKMAGLATTSLATSGPLARAQEVVRRGLPPVKITDVKTILIQPEGEHLVIVKVLTSEPGLYGIGCATHGERPLAVAAAIDQHREADLDRQETATGSRTSGRPPTSPPTSGAASR